MCISVTITALLALFDELRIKVVRKRRVDFWVNSVGSVDVRRYRCDLLECQALYEHL